MQLPENSGPSYRNLIKLSLYGFLRGSLPGCQKVPLRNGLIAFNTKIIRWGMRNSFSGSIMISVGKATSSRGQSARVAYFLGFLGNSQPCITGSQML